MQNQYFGDINDYHNYGLIRSLLAPTSISLEVAWMLRPNDGSNDGQRLSYLEKPDLYRSFDPELFDFLHETVLEKGRRDVTALEESGLIPGARFVNRILKDDKEQRSQYFERLLSRESDLIFFDPDNGLEVKSIARGWKDSAKYLFFDEIRRTWSNCRSMLIYQHFRYDQERNQQIENRVDALFEATNASWVGSFRASHALFLLVPQPRHEVMLSEGMNQVRRDWREEFKGIQIHSRKRV